MFKNYFFHVESNSRIKNIDFYLEKTKLLNIFGVNIGASMLNSLYNIDTAI